MGRKGIGKLSLLSIADVIEVRSKMDGEAPVGLRIRVSDVRKAMQEGSSEYAPESLSMAGEEFEQGHGTKIVVRKLKRERLRDVDARSLRRRLARRFSVVGSEDFRVVVNGEEVTPADRDDLKFVEYLWVFRGTEVDTTACQQLKEGPPLRSMIVLMDGRMAGACAGGLAPSTGQRDSPLPKVT